MNIRVPLSLVFGFVSLVFFGQWSELDTLKPTGSFLGTEDSIHRFIQPSQSILPSMGLSDGFLLNPMAVYQPMGAYLHPTVLKEKALCFSALPFMGFAYAFGTQGSQHLKFNYVQAYRHGLLLNVDYVTHGSNGFIRNNTWKNRDYSFLFAKTSGRYQGRIMAQGMSDYRQFSGGLLVDSLANSYALNLLPVRKDSCSSTWKMKTIVLDQAINFLKDSTRFVGLYEKSSLRSSERLYAEYDTLYSLYPVWYMDSTSTNDRYEWVSNRNEVGLGFKFSRIKARVGGVMDYWRMRMHGNQRDTLEIGINGTIAYHGNGWVTKFKGEHNITGAFQSFNYNGQVQISLGFKHRLNFSGTLAKIAPDVLQRTYLGNTIQYQMLSPQLQQLNLANLELEGGVLGVDYTLKLSGLNTKGIYQFNGLIWDNQTNNSSQQFLLGSLSLSKKWKNFNLGGFGQSLIQSSTVFPTLTAGANVGYAGYITKTKSLYFFSTINYRLIKGYKPLSISPQLSLLELNPVIALSQSFHSLTALVGFKVKTFRFFISAANVGSLWMTKSQPVYDHYPIPSLQIQLGILWEFWN